MEKYHKIALLGLHTDSNYGDPLICQCTQKLFAEIVEGSSWTNINLRRYFTINENTWVVKALRYAYMIVNKYIKVESLRFRLIIFILTILFYTYTKNCTLGIIAGGGIIHYKHHDYSLGISAFIKACKLRGIHVIVNAVGIEGFEQNDFKCQILSKALRMRNVKAITTRDDIETLRNSYLKDKNRPYTAKTVDPAIFAGSVYGVKKDELSNTIGIGLIRGNILKDFRVDYSLSDLVDYYVEVVNELDKKRISYEFFINGYKEDLNIVPLIEERLQRNITVRIPVSAEDLVATIAKYQAILTARMHSCIIAYSLNIPAVAFVWCEKLKFWGETINSVENFIPLDDLSSDKAIKTLENAIKNGYDETRRLELESLSKDIVNISIQKALKQCMGNVTDSKGSL